MIDDPQGFSIISGNHVSPLWIVCVFLWMERKHGNHMWDVLMAGWISLRFFIPQAGAKQTDKQTDDPSDPKMEILPSWFYFKAAPLNFCKDPKWRHY